PILDVLDRFVAELGITVPDGPTHLLGNPYIDICPPSVQHPEYRALPRRIELRPAPFSDAGEPPPAVTRHDRPPVFFTLGTAFGSAAVLRTAVDGVAALDVDVLVTTGPVQISELGALPDNVTAVPWVP